jgi:lipopolysaccharide heptosyltransferase II
VNVPALQNILVVRTDRIGDVVLSLPMIPVLKSRFPAARIAFLLRSYTLELVARQPGLDHLMLYDDEQGKKKPFGLVLSDLRRHSFDAVVVTYPTFRLACLMYLAGIPLRVGTGYRWYSFLFNQRVYEHRRTAEKHEAEYNLTLLKMLDCSPLDQPRPVLMISRDAEREADSILEEIGLSRGEPFVILHPGSGGSARDWRPENFGELALRLRQSGMPVLVTGGPGEEGLLARVFEVSGGTARLLPRTLPLMSLAALIKTAAVFVSNSTGPMHIAAAVGTPVVAFFPPIRQCSSGRWGPLTTKKIIFEPRSADCPRCKGRPCESNDCMELIRVNDVEKAVLSLAVHSARGVASL